VKKNACDAVITGPTTEQQRRDVDAYLEELIEAQRAKLVSAQSPQERKDAWYSMKSLIESRSPQRIRQMEVVRGLRK
jgi:hypothetical protein